MKNKGENSRMITFIVAVAFLILGYFLYGKLVDRAFVCDERMTPAIAKNDGVDYVPMPLWKTFLIQLLNIAGTGPIFGALSGAIFHGQIRRWLRLYYGARRYIYTKDKGISIDLLGG